MNKLNNNRFRFLNNRNLTPQERVALARHPKRPNIRQYIDAMFSDFFELHGDRAFGDDHAIVGGIATFCEIPVTVVGHQKGRNLDENMNCNFGMPNPEGYRKALRLFKQAEKFKRPIITFIDTPGAYPGMEAEERGQGEAIAKNLFEMSALTVPIVSVVIGEGGSGGALALGVADRMIMLENSIYSVLSPEGFASILWKDSSRSGEASEVMKLTAFDLLEFGICDRVIEEPKGGAQENSTKTIVDVSSAVREELMELLKLKRSDLPRLRYEKYRRIGAVNFK